MKVIQKKLIPLPATSGWKAAVQKRDHFLENKSGLLFLEKRPGPVNPNKS